MAPSLPAVPPALQAAFGRQRSRHRRLRLMRDSLGRLG